MEFPFLLTTKDLLAIMPTGLYQYYHKTDKYVSKWLSKFHLSLSKSKSTKRKKCKVKLQECYFERSRYHKNEKKLRKKTKIKTAILKKDNYKAMELAPK